MSVTIRVDNEVYDRLKDQAEPFVDSPNSVLRRILGLGPVANAADLDEEDKVHTRVGRAARRRAATGTRGRTRRTEPRSKRAPAGALLPEEDYELPVLHALVENGGSAQSRDVIAAVGTELRPKFTDLDVEPISSGAPRWQNRVQFVRLRLVERGLLANDSPRGIWQITDAGREYATQAIAGVA